MKFDSIEDVTLECETNGKKYVVYRNLVLDVTKFEHPGPQELISDNIGTDITKLFDDQGHSKNALDLCHNI